MKGVVVLACYSSIKSEINLKLKETKNNREYPYIWFSIGIDRYIHSTTILCDIESGETQAREYPPSPSSSV